MQPHRSVSIWQLTPPAEWPLPPEWLSSSQLTELELCPLKWALRRASYPDIWKRRGYPGAFHIGAFNGQVLHLALERIGKFISSQPDASLVAALRQLGGLSAILKECIAETTRSNLQENPRIRNVRRLEEHLQAQLPRLRERLQVLLGSVSAVTGTMQQDLRSKSGGSSRYPLASGSHVEIDVRSEDLAWIGRIDLLQIDDKSIEIVDFKSGEIQEHDLGQLQIYALLWARDHQLNPGKRLADNLRLISNDRNVSVAGPTSEQLDLLANELTTRSESARSSLNVMPPHAQLNSECGNCDVRHLCESYWSSLKPNPQAQPNSTVRLDAQVAVKSRIGENNWNIEIERSTATYKAEAVLRNSQSDASITSALEIGRRFRILNGWLLSPTIADTNAQVLSLGDHSELFECK